MADRLTIVVGDGLTNAVLSAQHQYQGSTRNVGARESHRLLGRGKAFGAGPLPTLLRRAAEARLAGANVEVVLLRPGEPEHATEPSARAGHDAAAFVEPVAEIARDATVLSGPAGRVPLEALLDAVRGALGTRREDTDLRVLVVGCHTEARVTRVAVLLRQMLAEAHVAVASHLVGSATQEAHFAALRHNLPAMGVHVILDLEQAAEYAGLDRAAFAGFDARPCAIDPPEARDAISEDQRRIVELLCLHWTRTHLRPLAGGFSGSALYLAEGWKGDAKTQPMVIKIDAFQQMRRELDGYYQVKDFFGKHVPTFGLPVTKGESLGVGMELAAMSGEPETLQATFERAEDEFNHKRFLTRFDKALELLSIHLYGNTAETARVVPFRQFGLHAQQQQLVWLKENADLVVGYLEVAGADVPVVDVDHLVEMVRLVTRNDDGYESAICLVHGDLNFANVICDDGDNVWFIDWTHSGYAPVEADFAKLENDVKFVMSKNFDVEDLPRLKQFEEFLLTVQTPEGSASLDDTMKFAKWDLRFQKMLEAVSAIRRRCAEGKQAGEWWLGYRVALLKYAMHTLSFDKRRGRGECEPAQLMHALYAVEALTYNLVADDFHLRIRSDRPAEYPPRQRISIDEAPWAVPCPGYDPPYYVHPTVVAQNRLAVPGGWADPEDAALIAGELAAMPVRRRDASGRPLNPRGRTGIAGRGLLGLWGRNLSVAAVCVRWNDATSEWEIVLGGDERNTVLELPKGFVLPKEDPDDALRRVLESEIGVAPPAAVMEVVLENFTYDFRQTDHAWVESRATLVHGDDDVLPDRFQPAGVFEEVRWWPLDADAVNRVPSGQALFVREAVKRLLASGRMDATMGDALLAATGGDSTTRRSAGDAGGLATP